MVFRGRDQRGTGKGTFTTTTPTTGDTIAANSGMMRGGTIAGGKGVTGVIASAAAAVLPTSVQNAAAAVLPTSVQNVFTPGIAAGGR